MRPTSPKPPMPVPEKQYQLDLESVAMSQLSPVVFNPPQVDPTEPDASIPQLLKDSVAAHGRARWAKNRTDFLADLTIAAQLRLQAEQADPTFLSPAWTDESRLTSVDSVTHAALMAFYLEKGVL